MNQAPVSCIPAAKMSKAKKVLDEAREMQNPELDLADKNITTFEEMPGLREYTLQYRICTAVLCFEPNLVACRDWFFGAASTRPIIWWEAWLRTRANFCTKFKAFLHSVVSYIAFVELYDFS